MSPFVYAPRVPSPKVVDSLISSSDPISLVILSLYLTKVVELVTTSSKPSSVPPIHELVVRHCLRLGFSRGGSQILV